jgi:hypothetical protein
MIIIHIHHYAFHTTKLCLQHSEFNNHRSRWTSGRTKKKKKKGVGIKRIFTQLSSGIHPEVNGAMWFLFSSVRRTLGILFFFIYLFFRSTRIYSLFSVLFSCFQLINRADVRQFVGQLANGLICKCNRRGHLSTPVAVIELLKSNLFGCWSNTPKFIYLRYIATCVRRCCIAIYSC